MKNYQLKTTSKDVYILTEEQVKALLMASGKLVAIPNTKIIINLNCVESIVPEEEVDQSNVKETFLNDGRRVIKKFGVWVLADNPDIRVDLDYYPELRKLEKKQIKRLSGGSGFQELREIKKIKQLKSSNIKKS